MFKSAMSIDALLSIEHANFPLMVKGEHEMDRLRVLEAAEMIEVIFTHHPDNREEVALIMRITPAGRATINRCRREDAQRSGDM